ncbi:MAG: hypothetical protein ACP5OV_02540 [Acidimicrobiales bacterium]
MAGLTRLATRPLLLVAILGSGLGLSACGTSSAVGQARTACGYVGHALREYRQSQQVSTPSAARAALASRAVATLLEATPYAAAATSADGGWNPLMTTINEAERVPLRYLVASLTDLCAIADSPNPYL